jgi:hypothetical protein
MTGLNVWGTTLSLHKTIAQKYTTQVTLSTVVKEKTKRNTDAQFLNQNDVKQKLNSK